MEVLQEQLTTADNLHFFYRHVPAGSHSRQVAYLLHGWNEHGGRYLELMQLLHHQGYQIYMPDQRGHGLSEGPRGHVSSWQNYLDDNRALLQKIVTDQPEARITIIGHSMGGLIAIGLVNSPGSAGKNLAALVLSGPLLRLAIKVSLPKLWLARFMGKALPGFSLKNRLNPAILTSDQEKISLLQNDSLSHHLVSARWYSEMQTASQNALENADKIRLPVLLMHGGNDQLNDLEGSQEFFARLPGPDKKMIVWENMQHEIFNETGRALVFSALTSWLAGHNSQ